MPFHQAIQSVLLVGHAARRDDPGSPAAPPPPQLAPVVHAAAAEIAPVDALALAAGHRWRSAFWALYLMSAVAVLLGVLPAALTGVHARVPGASDGLFGIAEVAVIVAVAALYHVGMSRDWQGRWLRARELAERVRYLPLVAALRGAHAGTDWYAGLFDGDTRAAPDIDRPLSAACRRIESATRFDAAAAWQDPHFVRAFGRYAAGIFAGQRHYQRAVGARHHALQHRVHALSAALFVLTAVAAALHLVWHADGLLIITGAFPAFGAALHGALVQSESHRLAETAHRLDGQLGRLESRLEQLLAGPAEPDAASVHAAVLSGLGLLLDEHHDWHQLVRPHGLPLG